MSQPSHEGAYWISQWGIAGAEEYALKTLSLLAASDPRDLNAEMHTAGVLSYILGYKDGYAAGQISF